MPNSEKMTVSLPRALAEFARQTASSRHLSRSRLIADLLDAERRRCLEDSLAAGYRDLAADAQEFAGAAIALADEVWDRPGSAS